MSVKTASVTERKRKPTPSTSNFLVWLSRAQAETLAETVFGSKIEDTYIEVRLPLFEVCGPLKQS